MSYVQVQDTKTAVARMPLGRNCNPRCTHN